MNRNFLTIGEMYKSEDICNTNKNSYIALAKLAQAILGSSTLLNGFTCTQNATPNLNVAIGPGEIYQLAQVDITPFGSLPVDTHQILKQGINMDALPAGTLTFTGPSTPGQSVNYLIQFQLQEQDTGSENRSFFNTSPSVVNTIRQDSVLVQALAGTPAPTGTQTTPTPTTGFAPGFVVTIAYGETTILNSNISVYPNAPFINNVLGNMLTEAVANTLYAPLGAVTFRAWQSGTPQSIGGTPIIINFETEDFDTNNFYNNTTMTFQPTIAGYYRITASLGITVTGTAARVETEIWKNGVVLSTDIQNGTGDLACSVNDLVYFNGSTDYIQINVTNVGGGTTITTQNAINRTYFNAELIK